jgi:flagellar hook-associated protein 1
METNMSSTFYGLDIAKSGLNVSQLALNVTSNNIANVGTDGYTRQGIDQTTISAASGKYRFANPAVTPGKGVSADAVAQYRDDFLDMRYRNANSTDNTFTSSKAVLKSIEGIVDETNNDGLIVSLQGFYKSLQNLAQNTGDVQYSSLVRSGAKTVVGMLNQYSNSLESVADEQESNLQTSVDAVNSYVSKIDALNKSIVVNQVNGSDCNALMDERNTDLDKLSSFLNIEVEKNDDGSVSVLTDSSYLLDSQSNTITTLALDTSSGSAKIVDGSGTDFSITDGSIKGVLQSLNGLGGYAGSGEDSTYGIAYYRKALDEIASTFADTYNSINSSSSALFASSDSSAITASNICISSGWTSNASLIDTDNITNMISAMESDVGFTGGFTGTFEGFATDLMSEIATDVGYAGDMADTYSSIVGSIKNEREAISGVSTDEEAINTVKYQKAYQAAARVLTAMDEMLDKLINGTGTVGL